jgi:hypothetical protein
MPLGLSYFTWFHVILSLIAIVAGIPVVAKMISPGVLTRWTTSFFAFTIGTTATGFLFPFNGVTPAFITGLVSSAVLIVALYALYGRRLARPWRAVYVVTVLIAFYLNVFVLVVQSFQKLPFLNALAPTGSEPPFAIAQGIVLLGFLSLGWLALRRFNPMRVRS